MKTRRRVGSQSYDEAEEGTEGKNTGKEGEELMLRVKLEQR